LNDLLHITQFSSKWQLAAFYNRGDMVIVELPEYSLRKIYFGSWRKTCVDGSDLLYVYNL